MEQPSNDASNLANSLGFLQKMFEPLPTLEEANADGWFSRHQAAESMRVCPDTAGRIVDEHVSKGVFEIMEVRGQRGQKQKVYRPV